MRERERKRDRRKDRKTERQTDRQTDRQTERELEREREQKSARGRCCYHQGHRRNHAKAGREIGTPGLRRKERERKREIERGEISAGNLSEKERGGK